MVTVACIDPLDFSDYKNALEDLKTDPKAAEFEGDSLGNYLFGFPVNLFFNYI